MQSGSVLKTDASTKNKRRIANEKKLLKYLKKQDVLTHRNDRPAKADSDKA